MRAEHRPPPRAPEGRQTSFGCPLLPEFLDRLPRPGDPPDPVQALRVRR